MDLFADLLDEFIIMGSPRYLDDEYVFMEMHLHLNRGRELPQVVTV
jgi:hypothetical protein